MNTVKDYLEVSWARIADEKNWARGCWARDSSGKSVSVEDADACRWCAYGSVIATDRLARGRISGDLLPEADDLLDAAALTVTGHRTYVTVNDVLGHDAVRRVFERAIEAAS